MCKLRQFKDWFCVGFGVNGSLHWVIDSVCLVVRLGWELGVHC